MDLTVQVACNMRVDPMLAFVALTLELEQGLLGPWRWPSMFAVSKEI